MFGPAMFGPIRRRLVLWNVLVFVLVLAVIEGASYLALTRTFNHSVEAGLHARLRQQAAIAERVGVVALASRDTAQLEYDLAYPGIFALVSDARGHVVGAPAGLRALDLPDRAALRRALAGHKDERTVQRGAQDVRLLSAPVRVGPRIIGAIQVGRSLSLHERELVLVREIALLGGLLGAALALGGGLFLAGRALIPVHTAFEAQRTFVADASHELRTPLALLHGTAETLRQRYARDPARDRELVDDLLTDCAQLRRLVDDLLTLARADIGQMAVHPEPVSLDRLVADVCRRVRAAAAPRDIRVTWTVPGALAVAGDATRLAQLLWILFDNALAYTERGGAIDVALSARRGQATIRVADTGIGIPAADLPHIFERFYRVDAARTRSAGGTGLGLAIARAIARAHGGEIAARSQPGQGSVFTVTLPLLPDSRAGGEADGGGAAGEVLPAEESVAGRLADLRRQDGAALPKR